MITGRFVIANWSREQFSVVGWVDLVPLRADRRSHPRLLDQWVWPCHFLTLTASRIYTSGELGRALVWGGGHGGVWWVIGLSTRIARSVTFTRKEEGGKRADWPRSHGQKTKLRFSKSRSFGTWDGISLPFSAVTLKIASKEKAAHYICIITITSYQSNDLLTLDESMENDRHGKWSTKKLTDGNTSTRKRRGTSKI